MTPTEIMRKANEYIKDLDKNTFKCKDTLGGRCNRETHIRNLLRKAFYAGYETRRQEKE